MRECAKECTVKPDYATDACCVLCDELSQRLIDQREQDFIDEVGRRQELE